MADGLQDWNKGDPLAAAHWQQAVVALRRLLGVPGSTIAELQRFADGWRFRCTLGKVVAAGPNGESDRADERYWVQDCTLKNVVDNDIDDQIELEVVESVEDTLGGDAGDDDYDLSNETPTIHTVTNIAELDTHSHNLAVGRFVWYFTLVDGQEIPVTHLAMSEGGSGGGDSVVRVTAVGSPLGVYTARLCTPPTQKSYANNDATTYTDGSAFADGDYALNLSDNIVYHRVTGSWVNAVGHLTDADIDLTQDLPDTQADAFVNSSTEINLVNFYESTSTNMDNIISPLIVGRCYKARYWFTNSDGDVIYVTEGAFHLPNAASNYQVIMYNTGNWVIDHIRAHT